MKAYTTCAEAHYLMNGETRFPTAMSSYDAGHRSDVATVCSGSVLEDIEVESVFSQEDTMNSNQQFLSQQALHSDGTTQPPSQQQQEQQQQQQQYSSPTSEATVSRPIKYTNSKHVVEFAAPILLADDELVIAKSSYGSPAARREGVSVGTNVATTDSTTATLGAATESPIAFSSSHKSTMMGPPLDRTFLLLQKCGSNEKAATGEGGDSVKSFGTQSDDCGGSLDVEAHSIHSQEGDAHNRTAGSITERSYSSRPASVRSFEDGSQQTDGDCGGSLDVETQSIETRSIHSQEVDFVSEQQQQQQTQQPSTPVMGDRKLPLLRPNDNEGDYETRLSATVPAARTLMVNEEGSEVNGRRSPGGTIYKGRGNRRYVGRYMHLPLKRFHNDGRRMVEIADAVNMLRVYDDRKTTLLQNAHLDRRRLRSRSRSRSPETHTAKPDGTKPPACP